MGTKNQYTDISSASETSLPDLGLSAYDDILNDLIYSNGRAEKPSEFSQLQEKKDRRCVGTGSEGRSAMTGKPTIAANTKFKAYSNETKTKLRCSVNKKTDIRKVTSCLNLNKCQCRKTRKQRSFTDLRHNCGQSGCQDDGLSPGASKSRKMSYAALSRTYWYVINNKEIEQCRFRTCKGWHRRLLQDKVMLYRHIIEYTEILACTSRGVSGWYIADMEGRRAESVSRLKRYYMSYSEVCSQLDSGPPNKQDRRSCYGEVRSNFPLRREVTPRRDHETNDKIVNVVSNCPLSTVDRLTSGQYVSSSKVKPAASSIETDSRRHQPYGHSVPAGADTRIHQPNARMLEKGTDSRRHQPYLHSVPAGADPSRDTRIHQPYGHSVLAGADTRINQPDGHSVLAGADTRINQPDGHSVLVGADTRINQPDARMLAKGTDSRRHQAYGHSVPAGADTRTHQPDGHSVLAGADARIHQPDGHSVPAGADARIHQPDGHSVLAGADARIHQPDARKMAKVIDSRRHQAYGHSVPAGADTRILQPDGHSVLAGADARILQPDARKMAKVTDSNISSVQLQDLKQHSNGNEHKPGDKCRRLPSNTIRPDSVSKHSLNKQEATDQRESTISLHRDSSSSTHQDQSSSGQKEHPAEKDSTLNVSHSRQRHHEPPAESHQYFRSRTTVYTYDNNGQKFSKTYYQEHDSEGEGAQLQDRDHHRERASGFGDRRRRSMSRSRRMDDRDTERHVREDNTDRRPRSHESRQKSQDHEVGVFTSMARRTESERRRENSRELDRKTSPQARLGTPGDLQVGKASEESKASLYKRKQVQPTVAVHEREDPCTKFSTEDHQTGPQGESLSTSDHSCNSLQQARVPGPRDKSKTTIIRQSISSALALLEQPAAGFDENLHELSCPGAAGEESGEHTPHKPHVGLTSPQSRDHILQPFRRDLCARDSDGPNQMTPSSDKSVGDFDVAKQNVSSTDNDRIGCDEQRHKLSLPNRNGKFSDRQNQQRHSRPPVTADKSQMGGRDMNVCSSSLKGSNKGCDKGVKQDCVNSSRFFGSSASIQGRGSVSGRKHYLSHDVNPIEPVKKRQKTLPTGEFNLTRLQRCAFSGITDANKARQPLLPSVELKPTHGEPFLKRTSSLAQVVEEERTLNNNNIGAVRYADKTPEHRLLFPGKIADDTSTCTDDMTFEMAHSSPRYSESSDKIEYFTTDSELDSTDMSDSDEESSDSSHRGSIKFSRAMSSSQNEEYLTEHHPSWRNVSHGVSTGKRADIASDKRHVCPQRDNSNIACTNCVTISQQHCVTINDRSKVVINSIDGRVHEKKKCGKKYEKCADDIVAVVRRFCNETFPDSSYLITALASDKINQELGTVVNIHIRTECRCKCDDKKIRTECRCKCDDKKIRTECRCKCDDKKIRTECRCKCDDKKIRTECRCKCDDKKIPIECRCKCDDEKIRSECRCKCDDEKIPTECRCKCDDKKIRSECRCKCDDEKIRTECRCKCDDKKDLGDSNYKIREYRRPAEIELDMNDSLVTSKQNGWSVYINIRKHILDKCHPTDPRVHVVRTVVPNGINNDSKIGMSPDTQQGLRNIPAEADVSEHRGNNIAPHSHPDNWERADVKKQSNLANNLNRYPDLSTRHIGTEDHKAVDKCQVLSLLDRLCHTVIPLSPCKEEEGIALPKIPMLESRKNIDKSKLLSLIDEFCHPVDLLSPLSSDGEEDNALPTIPILESSNKFELANDTTINPSGDPPSRKIPSSISEKCINNNNKKRGNNKDISNHSSIDTPSTAHTQNHTSTEILGAQFSHIRTPSHHIVYDNLLNPQVLTPDRRIFLLHSTPPRGLQQIDKRILCGRRFACQPTRCNCFLEAVCRRLLTSDAYNPEHCLTEIKLISSVIKSVIDSRLFMLSSAMLAGNVFVISDGSTSYELAYLIPTTSMFFELNLEAVIERRHENKYCRNLTIKVISVSRKTNLSHLRELKLEIVKGMRGNTIWKTDERNQRLVHFGSLYSSPALYWATLAGIGEYHLSIVTFDKPLTTDIGPDSYRGLNSVMLLDKQMNIQSLNTQFNRCHSILQQSQMVLFPKLNQNKRILYFLSVNRSLAFRDVPIRRNETLQLTRSCADLSSEQSTHTCRILLTDCAEHDNHNCQILLTDCAAHCNQNSRILLTDCAAHGNCMRGVLRTSGNVRLRERHVGRNISSQRKDMRKYNLDFAFAQIKTQTLPPEVTITKWHYEANQDRVNDLPEWSLSKMKNGGRKKDLIGKLTMCFQKKGTHLKPQTSQDSDNSRKRCKKTRDVIRFLDSNNNADNEASKSTSRRKNTTRSGQATFKLPQRLHKKADSEEKQRQQKGKGQQQQTEQQDEKEQERVEETHLPELAETGERYGDVQNRLREVRINLLKTYRAQQVSSHNSSFASVFDQLPEDDDNTNAEQQENTDLPSSDEHSGTLPQIPMTSNSLLGRSSSFASASELERNKVLKFVQRMNTSYGERLVKGNAANKERLSKVCNHYLNMNWAKKQVGQQPQGKSGIFSSPSSFASLSNLMTKTGDLQCSSANASDTCQRAPDGLQTGNTRVRPGPDSSSTDKPKTKLTDKASDSGRKNTAKLSETKTVSNKTESKINSVEVMLKSDKRNKTSAHCASLRTPVNKRLNPHIAESVNRLSSRPQGQALRLLHSIHNWEEEFGRPLSVRPDLDCLSLAKGSSTHAQAVKKTKSSQSAHVSNKACETRTEQLGKQKATHATTSRGAKESGQLNKYDQKIAAFETDHRETIDEEDEEDGDDFSSGSDDNTGNLSVNAHLAKLSLHALTKSKSTEKIDMPDLQEQSQPECLDSVEKIYNEMQAQYIERKNALEGIQQVRNKHALVEDEAEPETSYEAFGLGTLSPLNPVISEDSPFGFLNLVDHPPVNLLSENSSNIYRRLEENQYLGAGGYKDDKHASAQRSSPKTKLSTSESQQNHSGREPCKDGHCSGFGESKEICDPMGFVDEVNEIKYIANIAESQFTGEEGVFHAAALPSGMGGAFLRDLLKLNRNNVTDTSFDGSEMRSLNMLGDSDSETELVAQTALEEEAEDLYMGDDDDEDNEEEEVEGVDEQKEGICSTDINGRGEKTKGNTEETRDEKKETCEQRDSSRAAIDNTNAKTKGHYDMIVICDDRDDEIVRQTKTSINEEKVEDNLFREVGTFNAGSRSPADVSDRFIPLESENLESLVAENLESLESLKRAADMSFRGEFRFVPQLGMQFLDVKDGLRPSCTSTSVNQDSLTEARGLADARTAPHLSPIAEVRDEDVTSPSGECQGRHET